MVCIPFSESFCRWRHRNGRRSDAVVKCTISMQSSPSRSLPQRGVGVCGLEPVILWYNKNKMEVLRFAKISRRLPWIPTHAFLSNGVPPAGLWRQVSGVPNCFRIRILFEENGLHFFPTLNHFLSWSTWMKSDRLIFRQGNSGPWIR